MYSNSNIMFHVLSSLFSQWRRNGTVIATTHKQNILKHLVYGSCSSDHELTGIITKKNCRKFQPRKILTRNYTRCNVNSFKEDLRYIPWDKAIYKTDINNAWDKFRQFFKSVIDKYAPLVEKQVRGGESPWLSHGIKTKINENYYLRRARNTGKEID